MYMVSWKLEFAQIVFWLVLFRVCKLIIILAHVTKRYVYALYRLLMTQAI